ncbi:diguanylate cyclase [uncultured Azohydromonas sp.]|uniref:sensor domain-containing diguanylate cyclase n=1 Tax=uncultured Azohydromonas sp. TaxID=487342 RepID=UPI0026092D05|nr:diguanylate cyclase [uncultured Azohydromonas sp.]
MKYPGSKSSATAPRQAEAEANAPVPCVAARELRRFVRWLVAVNVIVGGVLALAIFQALNASHEVHANRARNATENLVEGLKDSISAHLKLVDSALLNTRLALGHLRQHAPLERDEVHRVLSEQQSLVPQMESLRVTDAQGNLLFGAGVPTAPRVNISDLDFFRRARDASSDEVFVSEPLESRINGKWIVVLARRMADTEGRFAGVVYGTLLTGHFSAMFEGMALGQHGAITLRSGSLRLVARHTPGDTGPQPVGSARVSAELAAAVKAAPAQGFFVSRTKLDGIERTNAYRRIDSFPLYILAGLATDEFFAPWRVDAAANIALLAALTLLLAGSSALVLRSRTRQYHAQQEVSRLVAEQALMLDSELIGIVRLKHRRITWVNKGLERMFGYRADELIGQSARIFYGDDQTFEEFGKLAYPHLEAGRAFRAPLMLRRKSGEPIWVDASGTWMQGQPGEMVWMTLDITKDKLQHDEVVHAALYDLLTGLPNRRLMLERLKLCMQSCERFTSQLAVAFIDLDGFKAVNDAHGHDAGDVVLRVAAQRMQGAVRACDTVARIGGDEFVVILNDLEERAQCAAILERIRSVVSEPIIIPGKGPCTVSASIGVEFHGPRHTTPESLMTAADEAMYQAKKAGRNRVHGLPARELA